MKELTLINQLNIVSKESKSLAPIVEFILTQLIPLEIVTNSSIVVESDVTVLKLSVNSLEFSFCFWRERFSFFIEEREVLDEYLTNDLSSGECVDFLKVIFCHQIEVEYQVRDKDKKPYKIIYRYYVRDKIGKPTLFTDTAVVSFTILPKKSIERKIVYPLIPC